MSFTYSPCIKIRQRQQYIASSNKCHASSNRSGALLVVTIKLVETRILCNQISSSRAPRPRVGGRPHKAAGVEGSPRGPTVRRQAFGGGVDSGPPQGRGFFASDLGSGVFFFKNCCIKRGLVFCWIDNGMFFSKAKGQLNSCGAFWLCQSTYIFGEATKMFLVIS